MGKRSDGIIKNTSGKAKPIDSDFAKLMSKHLEMKHVDLKNSESDYDIMFYDFEDNPAYRVVQHGDKDVGVHIIDEGVTNNLPKRNVIPKPPYRFKPGDVITDDYGNWLCTAINETFGYNKAFFQSAHGDLKWISDGVLHNKPAIVTAKTLYTTGVKDEGEILVPNGMIGILVTLDEDTHKIVRGVNFLFNGVKYRVTFKDVITVKGVLSMICEEINISNYDDLENGIPDRWDKDGNDKLKEGLKPSYPIKPEDVSPDPEQHPEFKDFKIHGRDNLNFNKYSKYTVSGNGGNDVEFIVNYEDVAFIREKGSDYCYLETNYLGGVITLTAHIKRYPEIKTTKQIIVGL